MVSARCFCVTHLVWNEWMCHSNFSFLTGASHPEQFVRRATELSYAGIGFCDYDGVYGIARAYRALKRLQKDGFSNLPQLFYGCELHLQKDHDLPLSVQDTIVLYALNHDGYFSLCQMITYAHRDGKKGANIPLEKLLEHDLTNIVCLQPMRGLLRQGRVDDYQQRCQTLKESFAEFLCPKGFLFKKH